MPAKRVILELGTGNDLHGGDYTKAALRAVQDALHHSSLAMLRTLGVNSKTGMFVDVTIGVQQPAKVDLEKVSVNRIPGFNPRGGFGAGAVSTPAERLLAFHPIVLGEQVIVCDGARVLAYNLNDRPADSEASALRVVAPVWFVAGSISRNLPQTASPPKFNLRI